MKLINMIALDNRALGGQFDILDVQAYAVCFQI